jgi:hypothetical protein
LPRQRRRRDHQQLAAGENTAPACRPITTASENITKAQRRIERQIVEPAVHQTITDRDAGSQEWLHAKVGTAIVRARSINPICQKRVLSTRSFSSSPNDEQPGKRPLKLNMKFVRRETALAARLEHRKFCEHDSLELQELLVAGKRLTRRPRRAVLNDRNRALEIRLRLRGCWLRRERGDLALQVGNLRFASAISVSRFVLLVTCTSLLFG